MTTRNQYTLTHSVWIPPIVLRKEDFDALMGKTARILAGHHLPHRLRARLMNRGSPVHKLYPPEKLP